MRNISLRDIRLQPAGRASISGLSRGIGQAFNISPNVVRAVWLVLYVIVSGAPAAVADGVLADGLIGWVYLGWLLTGGSPVVTGYLIAWACIPDAAGQRSARPLLLWVLLLLGPLAAMLGLALLGL
jgi:phage shock protein PspC (stress-responsive transcriptional regulator)